MKLWKPGMIAAVIALGWSFGVQAQDTSATEKAILGWAASAHADATAEAFTHWNEEGEIPATCATCHAGAGLRALYGFDGSPAGDVPPMPTGGVVDCDTCHIAGALDIAEVGFPSGATIAPPRGSATCYTCHQGRQSGPGVTTRLAGKEDDAVDPELGLVNPHYKAAAATLLGGTAAGMFQFPEKSYAQTYAHAPEPSCTSCHDPHSLKIDGAGFCANCHGVDDPKAIRVRDVDVDGDGDNSEGISAEIATLHAALGAEILAYSRTVAGAPVAYAPGVYPYFFNDTNGDGIAGADEAAYPNRYSSWTPRMLRAAYNYQFIAKDPGAYAHNPDYSIQILIDTIEHLTGAAPDAAVRP